MRSNLRKLEDTDGKYLEKLFVKQKENPTIYPLDEIEQKKLKNLIVKTQDSKQVSVAVPKNEKQTHQKQINSEEPTVQRELIRIQALLADIVENIFVLGYPLTPAMGEEVKLTNGIISLKSGFQGDITLYQMTAPIRLGNSGVPMFDKDGNIVGIVNAKHVGAENVGYAVKTSCLYNLIDDLSTT